MVLIVFSRRGNGYKMDGAKLSGWFKSPAGRAAGVALCVALIVCYWLLQVRPLLGDRGTGIAGMASHQNDFKHLYLGSVLLSHGLSPYKDVNMLTMTADMARQDPRFGSGDELRIQPYVYLPFTGLVLRPLTLLPFAKSAVVFQLLNHACVLGAVGLTALACGWWRKPWGIATMLAMVAFNASLTRQNTAGQLNAMLLFGFALLYLAVSRKWPAAAVGAIAAFLMLFKLSPGIFLIWFLLRREWSRAAWMAGVAGLLTVVTVCLYSFGRHLEFLPVLEQMGYGKSTWSQFGRTFWRDPYNQSFNALFHRLLVSRPDTGIAPWLSLTAGVANALTWMTTAAILGLFGWRASRRGSSVAAGFSLAVTASLLVPSIMWDHYLVQLVVPMGLLLMVGWGSRHRVLVIALVASSSVIASMPVALDHPSFRQGVGLLAMSLKLLPVLICFAMGGLLCGEAEEGSGARPSPLTSAAISRDVEQA